MKSRLSSCLFLEHLVNALGFRLDVGIDDLPVAGRIYYTKNVIALRYEIIQEANYYIVLLHEVGHMLEYIRCCTPSEEGANRAAYKLIDDFGLYNVTEGVIK